MKPIRIDGFSEKCHVCGRKLAESKDGYIKGEDFLKIFDKGSK